jgi:sugar phosphate isomerase/epimerase
MVTPSGHYMPDQIKGDWTKTVDVAATVGQKYMFCALIMSNVRSLERLQKLIDLLNQAGETCRKAGIQFGYHHHNFELMNVGGQIPYEMILNGTDPKLVKLELDLYWESYTGKDLVHLFKQDPGRFPCVHMIDMAKTEKREFAEVGTAPLTSSVYWMRLKLPV